jgi:sugar phosphate isomerase/epimerase
MFSYEAAKSPLFPHSTRLEIINQDYQMKLSITIQTPEVGPAIPIALLSGTLQEKIEKSAKWGADGVELLTTNPKELDPEEILALVRQNSLEVAAVASGGMAFALGFTLLNADASIAAQAKTRLYDLIEFAAAVGAPVVTIGSFRGRSAWVGGQGKTRLRDILGEAAGYADQHSVRLALEAINRFEGDMLANAAEALAFIDDVNQPALGLLLDTFHVNIEEASWTEPFRTAMRAGKLYHVHLGDNNRMPPGHGLIDFPAIVATLQATGYTGYLSAELLCKPDADTAARQTLEYMGSLLRSKK